MISHLFPAGYGVRMFLFFCTYYFVLVVVVHSIPYKGLLPFGLISEESMLLTRSTTEDFLGPVIGWMPSSFTSNSLSFFFRFRFII